MELFHTSSPRSGTSQDSFQGCLVPFIEHLQQEGLTEGRIRCLRASARHFLVWLGQEGIDIGAIDDAVLRRFRRHDCRCPGMAVSGDPIFFRWSGACGQVLSCVRPH